VVSYCFIPLYSVVLVPLSGLGSFSYFRGAFMFSGSASPFEHSNEPSGSIKSGEFLKKKDFSTPESLLKLNRVKMTRVKQPKRKRVLVQVFCVVTPCSVSVGYQLLGGSCCPEDGILPQHYTASQPRPLLEFSSSRKLLNPLITRTTSTTGFNSP
jgi:hypothetical protein